MNAVTAIILLLELAMVVAGIQLIVVPEIRRDREVRALVSASRVDDGEFQTPQPATPAGDLGIDPVALPRADDFAGQIQATPLPSPTPVGTIIPADPPIGCDRPEAQLIVPGNGMRVFQPISVVGTVFADQFGLRLDRDYGTQHLRQFSGLRASSHGSAPARGVQSVRARPV